MDTKSPKEIKKKLKGTLMGKRTKDAFIFLFFVSICTIFWFVRELEESFTTEVVVPVKLVDVPKGVIITTDVPNQLHLNIHDKGVELIPLLIGRKLDTLRISFKTYDNHEPTGHGVLMLNQLQSSLRKLLPPGASVISMNPDTVYFYYNRGLHKRVPVKLHGTIEAAPQYAVTHAAFTPDSVDVYAPLSILDTLKAVYTERVDMKEQNRGNEMSLKLRTMRGMRTFPDSVTINTEVDILTRESAEVPVVGINFPANKTLRTFPSSVKVSYLVPQSQAKKVDVSEFVVVISYTELLDNSSSRCRPHLTNTPESVNGALLDPLEVDYLLENVETEEEKPTLPKKKRGNK